MQFQALWRTESFFSRKRIRNNKVQALKMFGINSAGRKSKLNLFDDNLKRLGHWTGVLGPAHV
jgi:hypothetical protein